MVDKRLHILSLFVPVEVAFLILKFAKEKKKKKIINEIIDIKIKQPRQKHMMKYHHTQRKHRAYSI